MSTCQVNAEESAAQPLKQLPQRSAAAAADDDVSMGPLAKVSRTHEAGPLSQHTVPWQDQEDVKIQQCAWEAALRRQDQTKDKEVTRLAVQHNLDENVARLDLRDAGFDGTPSIESGDSEPDNIRAWSVNL